MDILHCERHGTSISYGHHLPNLYPATMMIGSLPSPWLTYLFLENLSRRLRLRCNELFEIHRFLLQPFQTTTSEECETRDREFRKVEGYLNDWRARNVSIAGLFVSYVTTPGRTVRFDPTLVLANTGYNM